ncbi:MAG: translocation/assembly module TamB domain-containing protein, partial [Acidobacteriaceae bacterium]|nr:translocation/assembly module TamB domain-containing protein [Acidobacteriaceae bacterium]
QKSFDLPIDTAAKAAPKSLSAEASVQIDTKNNAIQIKTAHLSLGQTSFQASGTLNPAQNSRAQFNAEFALNELATLLKVSGVKAAGVLQANGTAKLDAQNNYAVDGTLNSRDLSLRSGTTRFSNVGLYSPFHADPYLISLDGLKLNALGGSLAAKIFIEKLQHLSVEGSLRDFSLPVLASLFTGKRLDYDGTINGAIKAAGNLKAKGTTGYTATTDLVIDPGHRGVPVSGRLNASYNGARDLIDVGKSYIAMPNSRIDLEGTLNRQLNVNLVSHNLNDFLPAANFGSAKPQTSLPVTLQNGAAQLQAQVSGNLSAPQITSHFAMDHFAIEQRGFDRLALDLTASQTGANVQNGLLTRNTLQTNFDASIGLKNWSPLPRSPLTANVAMRNGNIADLLSLAGESAIPATGNLNADVHINGTYGNPLGNANLQVVNGSAYGQLIDRLYTNVNLTDQLVTLSQLELASGNARVNANGTFSHPRDSFSVGHAQLHLVTANIQLADIQPLQKQSPGVAGLIQLNADTAADLRQARNQTLLNIANINADLSARGLRVQNQDAGDLTATARTVNNAVNYNVASNFAGSNIKINGQTALTKDYATTADAAIQNLSVEKALQIVGQGTIPARGNLSADAHVTGTLQAPKADLQFALARANLYGEPINRLGGTAHYTNTALNIPSFQLNIPAGVVTLNGAFTHPANDFNNGALQLKLDSTDIQVAKIQQVQKAKPGLGGVLRLAADLSANVREVNGSPELLFSRLNANAFADQLHIGNQNFGGLQFAAQTQGQDLHFRLDSDIAKGQIHATGDSRLQGDYNTRANLTFSNIRYSNIAPLISTEPAIRPIFDALVEGQASLNGPALDTDRLMARLQLDRLEVQTRPRGSPTGAPPSRAVAFRNEGPVIVALDHSSLKVQQLDIKGPRTTVKASGGMNLKDARSPLNLDVNANADLGVLQDIDRDFYSSGAIALNAVVRGSFAQPLVNGKVELKNANVNYAESPNGLSNANGVILLNGTNAAIQNLTGESGGGKVALSGFVGYVNDTVNFNLRATANRVRVRTSGVSVTSDAALTLAGSSRRSLLDGTITVQRLAYGASSDAGSFLSTLSTPPSTPEAPSPLLANMRLNVRILTAPDLSVISTYADRLATEANLTVRGTAATPGMLGTVRITDGQLVFFGNQYTVNTGTVSFYNPNAIEPVLNISLETIAQNVDVTLGVSGPMNNLQLSYRSDPPLTFEQIVQLLATNTTPADPTIAARQPAPPQQSLTQMGESAILGQAVANPLASRVQRVFGISALKIDPSLAGTTGPTANVTLQQKIASNITFTYITDVRQTNAQIIRVDWGITPRFSASGLRDFNGNVSLTFYYKFKVR